MTFSEMQDTAFTFFTNNVRARHGDDAEGDPCDWELESEAFGPYYPPGHESAGEELRCTCGYEQFEMWLRLLHPSMFEEDR